MTYSLAQTKVLYKKGGKATLKQILQPKEENIMVRKIIMAVLALAVGIGIIVLAYLGIQEPREKELSTVYLNRQGLLVWVSGRPEEERFVSVLNALQGQGFESSTEKPFNSNPACTINTEYKGLLGNTRIDCGQFGTGISNVHNEYVDAVMRTLDALVDKGKV